jgi:hypothetical protein
VIIPTLTIQVSRVTGTDLHSQPILKTLPPIRVAPVKLRFTNQHTTVRTDSSGSHGHADETAANVVLLALPNANIELEDVLTVVGHTVKVTMKEPRFDIGGKLDHYQLECVAWV